MFSSISVLKEAENKWVMNRKDLILSIKKIMIYASEKDGTGTFHFFDNELELRDIWGVTWSSSVKIDCNFVWWGELRIWLTLSFALEALNNLKCENVTFVTSWQYMPISVFDDKEIGFQYVLMPLRI